MQTELAQHIAAAQPTLEALHSAMQGRLTALGLGDCPLSPIDTLSFTLEQDPASGQPSLVGVWRDARGYKQGEALFHADGSYYAEHDVVRPHPHKPRWFVEAITAWGKGDEVKCDPRLIPMP